MAWKPLDFREALDSRAWNDAKELVARGALPDDWSAKENEPIFHGGYRALQDTVGFVWDAWNNELAPEDEKSGASLYPRIDSVTYKHEMPAKAKLYMDTPSIHTQRFTGVICAGLLDSEIYPLGRELAAPELLLLRLGAGRSFLRAVSEATGKKAEIGYAIARGILLLLWRLFLVIGFIFALMSHLYTLAVVFGVLAALSVWSAVRYRKASMARRKVLAKFRSIHQQLQQTRDEITSGSYDPATMVRRLEELERSGAYVPSLVYALLRLGSAGQARPAGSIV